MADSIPDLPSGSYSSRKVNPSAKAEPERETLEKVVSGEVRERKRPLGRRLGEAFAGDDAQTVGQFVLFEVILPSVKQTIVDVVKEGIDRLVMGGDSRRPSSGSKGSYTPYSVISSGGNKPSTISYAKSTSVRGGDDFGLDEVLFESRGDAEVVLGRMWDQLREYKVVTVADLKDFIGKTSDFTDNKFGWLDLRGADARRAGRDGYYINFPRPTAL